jgi:hypothetical protein
MNIEDAMNKVKNQPNQGETLHVVGSIEKDADGGKIRVYPDPYDMSRYVLIDPQSIAEKCSTLPSIGGRPGAVLGFLSHVPATETLRGGVSQAESMGWRAIRSGMDGGDDKTRGRLTPGCFCPV